jgi:hypothetical protein
MRLEATLFQLTVRFLLKMAEAILFHTRCGLIEALALALQVIAQQVMPVVNEQS